MPAKSKSQQKAAGAALSAKKGDKKKSDLKGPSKSMYESMSKASGRLRAAWTEAASAHQQRRIAGVGLCCRVFSRRNTWDRPG